MPVTGPLVPGTVPGEQSETASTVVKMATLEGELIRHTVTVAFNDVTGEVQQGFITYDPTNRRIYPGASLAGWSYSDDGGQHLSYALIVLCSLGPAFCAIGCGSEPLTTVDATTPDADDLDVVVLDDTFFNPHEASWDRSLPDVNPYEGYNVVDGGPLADGNWAPCKQAGVNHAFTCCNGELCYGFCEGFADGATQCSCFGIAGGCGTLGVQAFCCTRSRGCEGQPCGPGGK